MLSTWFVWVECWAVWPSDKVSNTVFRLIWTIPIHAFKIEQRNVLPSDRVPIRRGGKKKKVVTALSSLTLAKSAKLVMWWEFYKLLNIDRIKKFRNCQIGQIGHVMRTLIDYSLVTNYSCQICFSLHIYMTLNCFGLLQYSCMRIFVKFNTFWSGNFLPVCQHISIAVPLTVARDVARCRIKVSSCGNICAF